MRVSIYKVQIKGHIEHIIPNSSSCAPSAGTLYQSSDESELGVSFNGD